MFWCCNERNFVYRNIGKEIDDELRFEMGIVKYLNKLDFYFIFVYEFL